MISCSSTLASSAPATSAKVSFGVSPVSSLAFDFPKEKARLPPDCICRKRKTQSAMIRSIGRRFSRTVMNPLRDSFASMVTPEASSRVWSCSLSANGRSTVKPLAERESCSTCVRNSPSRRLPSMTVTWATLPASSCVRNDE